MNLEGEESEKVLVGGGGEADDVRLFVEENDISTSLEEGVSS